MNILPEILTSNTARLLSETNRIAESHGTLPVTVAIECAKTIKARQPETDEIIYQDLFDNFRIDTVARIVADLEKGNNASLVLAEHTAHNFALSYSIMKYLVQMSPDTDKFDASFILKYKNIFDVMQAARDEYKHTQDIMLDPAAVNEVLLDKTVQIYNSDTFDSMIQEQEAVKKISDKATREYISMINDIAYKSTLFMYMYGKRTYYTTKETFDKLVTDNNEEGVSFSN